MCLLALEIDFLTINKRNCFLQMTVDGFGSGMFHSRVFATYVLIVKE